MDDHVSQVQNHPLGGVLTLGGEWGDPHFPGRVLEVLRDGTHLTAATAVDNDEVAAVVHKRPDMQDDGVLCLFIEGCKGESDGLIVVQIGLPRRWLPGLSWGFLAVSRLVGYRSLEGPD